MGTAIINVRRELLPIVMGVVIISFPAGLHARELAVPSGKFTLKTVGGDTLNGTPLTVRPGAVSIMTDYGVVRVPLDKLTDESKAKLWLTCDLGIAALKRIAELESLAARLQKENAQLKRSGQAVPAALATAKETTTYESSHGPHPSANLPEVKWGNIPHLSDFRLLSEFHHHKGSFMSVSDELTNEKGRDGATTPRPMTSHDRLGLCRTQIVGLYYQVVPHADVNGHPGLPGWLPTQPPPSADQMLVDEIVATLTVMRPYLGTKGKAISPISPPPDP